MKTITILRFELRTRFKRPETYGLFLAFFCFSFYSVNNPLIFQEYGGAAGRIFANSAMTISKLFSIMGIWLVPVCAALATDAVAKDRISGVHTFYYALPLERTGYVLGRYLGALSVLLFISLGILLGIAGGYLLVDHPPEVIQPYHARYFIQPFVYLVLANVLYASMLFFSLGTLTKTVMGGYVAAVVLVALHLLSAKLSFGQGAFWPSVLDPLGEYAVQQSGYRLSIVEKNTQPLSLSELVLANRLLWLGLGALLLVMTVWRFRFAAAQVKANARLVRPQVNTRHLGRKTLRQPKGEITGTDNFHKLWRQVRMELSVLKSAFFGVLLLAAIAVLLGEVSVIGEYPLVGSMIGIKDAYFTLIALVILVVCAGELVHRERELRLSAIYDALPAPNWVFSWAKLMALFVVAFVLVGVVLLVILGYLVYRGAYIDWGIYFTELYLITLPYYLLLAVLCFCVQVLVKNKYLGHLVIILVFLVNIFAKNIKLDHNLILYGAPPKPLSGPLAQWGGYRIMFDEIVGYAPFLEGRVLFTLYWTFFAGMLVVLSDLLWKRGIGLSFAERWRLAANRFAPAKRWALLGLLGSFLVTGSYIYYNTNVLNRFVAGETKRNDDDILVRYEQRYRKYAQLTSPVMTRMELEVDLFPGEKRAVVDSWYTLVNRSEKPIDTLCFSTVKRHPLTNFKVMGRSFTKLLEDGELGFYLYRLDQPLEPGDSLKIGLSTGLQTRGFRNESSRKDLVFTPKSMRLDEKFLPLLGFDRNTRIWDQAVRKRYGLKEMDTWPSVYDSLAWKVNTSSATSDWVRIITRVNTERGHVAVTEGKLLSVTEIGSRVQYLYDTQDLPVPFDFLLQDGVLSHRKEYWRANNGKKIEIGLYYLPAHDRRFAGNADQLFITLKKYLAQIDQVLGRVDLGSIRFVETPFGYQGGFTTPYFKRDHAGDSKGAMAAFDDHLRSLLARQLLPANVNGQQLYTKGLWPYLGHQFAQRTSGSQSLFYLGAHQQSYLQFRGSSGAPEAPVADADASGQTQKFLLVFYELERMIGKTRLMAALREFLERERYSRFPHYPTSLDFLDFIRPKVPMVYRDEFHELFYQVVTYKNKVVKSTARKLADGRYRVEVEFQMNKFLDDGIGNLKPLGTTKTIEVGFYCGELKDPDTQEAKPADYVFQHQFRPGSNHFSYTVDRLPKTVVMDYRYLLPNLNLLEQKGMEQMKVKETGQ